LHLEEELPVKYELLLKNNNTSKSKSLGIGTDSFIVSLMSKI
jgi:hypothetical protein